MSKNVDDGFQLVVRSKVGLQAEQQRRKTSNERRALKQEQANEQQRVLSNIRALAPAEQQVAAASTPQPPPPVTLDQVKRHVLQRIAVGPGQPRSVEGLVRDPNLFYHAEAIQRVLDMLVREGILTAPDEQGRYLLIVSS